jgi:hypothetical protein
VEDLLKLEAFAFAGFHLRCLLARLVGVGKAARVDQHR